MSVDWTKPIQTRDGDRARLVGTLNYGCAREMTRVVVRVGANGKDFGGVWTCYESGLHRGDSDIINVPPRKETREVEAWVVVDHLGNYRSAWSKEAYAVDDLRGYPDAQVVRLTGTIEVEVEE